MCHPFYTGTQKFVDTAGRVDKFQQRIAKTQAAAAAATKKKKKFSCPLSISARPPVCVSGRISLPTQMSW